MCLIYMIYIHYMYDIYNIYMTYIRYIYNIDTRYTMVIRIVNCGVVSLMLLLYHQRDCNYHPVSD